MIMKQKIKVDLNILTRTFATILIITLFFVYLLKGENIYVDLYTVALAACISLLTIVFLVIEKRRENPFVILLSLYVLLFYVFRVITLNIEPYTRGMNFVGERTVNDVNSTLLFILFSLFFLFMGLVTIKIKKIKTSYSKLREGNYSAIFMFVMLSFLVSYLFELTSMFGGNKFLSYYLSIFHPAVVLLFFLVFYYVNKQKAYSKNMIVLLLVVLLSYVLLTTLAGGRKTLLSIIMNITVIFFVIKSRVYLSLRMFFIVIFFGGVAFVLYDISTFFRWMKYEQLIILNESLDFSSLFLTYLDKGLMQTEGFAKIFDRIGFLDYEVDSMAGADLYGKVINPLYYLKSIIDNIIPGFSYFDVVRASQTKFFLQEFGYVPNNEEFRELNYNSQYIGGFSEMYTLFKGYFSIPIFYLVGLLFTYCYSVINLRDPYYAVLLRVLILLSFVGGAGFLESFGFDWHVIKLFFMLIAIILTYPLFRSRYREEHKTSSNINPVLNIIE